MTRRVGWAMFPWLHGTNIAAPLYILMDWGLLDEVSIR